MQERNLLNITLLLLVPDNFLEKKWEYSLYKKNIESIDRNVGLSCYWVKIQPLKTFIGNVKTWVWESTSNKQLHTIM